MQGTQVPIKQSLQSLHDCGTGHYESGGNRGGDMDYCIWSTNGQISLLLSPGNKGLFFPSSRAFCDYWCSKLPPGGHKHIENLKYSKRCFCAFSSLFYVPLRNKGITYNAIWRIFVSCDMQFITSLSEKQSIHRTFDKATQNKETYVGNWLTHVITILIIPYWKWYPNLHFGDSQGLQDGS